MNDFEKQEVYSKARLYPEHFKLVQIKSEAMMLRRFIIWMMKQTSVELPTGIEADRLIAQFFGISLEKIGIEKALMLQKCKMIGPRNKKDIG